MKCSHRSTTWLGSAVVLAGATLLAAAPALDPTPDLGARVRTAIVDAVRARLGQPAVVTIEAIEFRARVEVPVWMVARPDTGASLGRPARFALYEPGPGDPAGVRIGFAMATVRVETRHVRTTRQLARGEAIGPGDVATHQHDPGQIRLARMPVVGDLTGARTRRSVPAGAVITREDVRLPVIVSSGQDVIVNVAVGGAEIAARLIAGQSGRLHQVIRLVNPFTRRVVHGRVMGPGEVEVIP